MVRPAGTEDHPGVEGGGGAVKRHRLVNNNLPGGAVRVSITYRLGGAEEAVISRVGQSEIIQTARSIQFRVRGRK